MRTQIETLEHWMWLTNVNVDKVIFKMDKFGQRHSQHEIVYDKSKSKFACDCMLYEFKGIPCFHIICVMRLQHLNSFPTSLICNRWLKNAKSWFISCYQLVNMNNDMMIMARFGALATSCNKLWHIVVKKHKNLILLEMKFWS